MSGTGGTQFLSMGFDVLDSVASGLGDSSRSDATDAYNKRLEAYEKAMRDIDNRNAARRERVQRRNEVMGQMGGGYDSRSPTQEKKTGTVAKPDYDEADSWDVVSRVFGEVSDLLGQSGSSGQSQSNTNISNEAAAAMRSSPQVDTNYQPPAQDAPVMAANTNTYNYADRYNPQRRYLTA